MLGSTTPQTDFDLSYITDPNYAYGQQSGPYESPYPVIADITMPNTGFNWDNIFLQPSNPNDASAIANARAGYAGAVQSTGLGINGIGLLLGVGFLALFLLKK